MFKPKNGKGLVLKPKSPDKKYEDVFSSGLRAQGNNQSQKSISDRNISPLAGPSSSSTPLNVTKRRYISVRERLLSESSESDAAKKKVVSETSDSSPETVEKTSSKQKTISAKKSSNENLAPSSELLRSSGAAKSSLDVAKKRKKSSDDSEPANDFFGSLSAAKSAAEANKRKKKSDENLVSSSELFRPSNAAKSSADAITRDRRLTQDLVSSSGFAKPSNAISSSVKASSRKDPRRKSDESPKKQSSIVNNDYLRGFLSKSRVEFDEDEGNYVLQDDTMIICKKMQELLAAGEYQKAEFLEKLKTFLFENHYEEMNRALNQTVSTENDHQSIIKNPSILRILLQVPIIQNELLDILLQELTISLMVVNSEEEVPWVFSLIQQLRFLKIVKPTDVFIQNISTLLNSCPTWFKTNLIVILPEIVVDSQHQNVAEILVSAIDGHSEQINAILECISSLSLNKHFVEEIRQKMLEKLQRACDISLIPSIARFCLEGCSDSNIAKMVQDDQNDHQNDLKPCEKVMKTIKNVDLNPYADENRSDYYTAQILIVEVLKTQFQFSKDLVNAAFSVITNTNNRASQPMELIILLSLYSFSMKKTNAETILKKYVKQGYYRDSSLQDLYNDYVEVCKYFDQTAMTLASNLLKSPDNSYMDFAAKWLQLQFRVFNDKRFKQREIVEKMITLMGNNDQTAKKSLNVLCRISEDNEDKKYLQHHYFILRVLLDKMDTFDLQEVIHIHDMLQALCYQADSISDALDQDLNMLMRKQMSSSDSIIKSKGVAACLMLIKHRSSGDENSCKEVYKKIELILNYTENCPAARGFFYDTLTEIVIAKPNINSKLLESIYADLNNIILKKYLKQKRAGKTDDLDVYFKLPGEDDMVSVAVNLMIQKTELSSVLLPVLFKLFHTIYTRTIHKEKTSIAMLLCYGVFMPKELDSTDSPTLDSMMNCINWFRELINAFATETNYRTQSNIRKRLEQVIQLQCDLRKSLMFSESKYSPSPCYFHFYPVTPFNKLEKKIGKKGKTKKKLENPTIAIDNCESWQVGSILSIKNPMYFRQFSPDVLHLFDANISEARSESSLDNLDIFNDDSVHIPISHVCFVISELLSTFENSEFINIEFVKHLVKLLPKICDKLGHIVNVIKSSESEEKNEEKQAFKLITSLITAILEYKELKIKSNYEVLRDLLRVLAKQLDESNRKLKSSKELVGETFKYFQTFLDAAKELPLAASIVQLCDVLMQHSNTYSFTPSNRFEQSQMAQNFLSIDWKNEPLVGNSYTSAVSILLKNWINYSIDPLTEVGNVLQWLPEEVKGLIKTQDQLKTFPSINKSTFHLLYLKLFNGIIKYIQNSEKEVNQNETVNQTTQNKSRNKSLNKSMIEGKKKNLKLEDWKLMTDHLIILTAICKKLSTKRNLITYLRFTPMFYKLFIMHGLPVLSANFRKYHEVNEILSALQKLSQHLGAISVSTAQNKDMTLSRLVPAAKAASEQLVCQVKRLLHDKNSTKAIRLGFMKNKNLDGLEVRSQSTTTTVNDSSEGSLLNDIASVNDLTDQDISNFENEDDDGNNDTDDDEEITNFDDEAVEVEAEEEAEEEEEEMDVDEDETSTSY